MLIVANWKAYIEDLAKAKKLVALGKRLARTTTHTLVLTPPTPFLGALALPNTSRIAFAAQDVSASVGGAATGEVTAAMLSAVGATYTLIGHSEKRALGDTPAIVSEKMIHALAHTLIPILCIGEHERDSEGNYLSFIREEITSALAPFSPKERTAVIIAYEPLWAIGKTAAEAISSNELTEMVLYIRKVLSELLSGNSASRAQVLYGGSVEPANIRSLAISTQVDGFLIGRASVDEATLTQLVQELS